MFREYLVLLIVVAAAACATTCKKQDVAASSAPAHAGKGEVKRADIGETCGTIANIKCAESAFCDLESQQAVSDGRGSCRKRPDACDDAGEAEPVCGRDGKHYPSECHANMAGVDIVTQGANWVCKKG